MHGDFAFGSRAWRVLALAVLSAGIASCGSSDDGSQVAENDDDDQVTELSQEETTEWPTLGYDLANSRAIHAETAPSPDNVASLSPAWELDGINGVTGTPIVLDGTVYIGDWTGHVRALDADTGEEIWATDLETQYVGGSVAVDDEHVYAGTFNATVVALDRETGEPRWEVQIDDHSFAAVFGSPIHVDGLLIVPVGSFENMVSSGEDATFRGSLAALDASTGDEVWRYWTTTGDEQEGPGVGVWASPAVDRERGVLYFGTGQHHAEPTSDRSDSVIALDLETGEEVWMHQFTSGDVWTLADGGEDSDVSTPPNLFRAGDVDAVGAGDKAGTYRALNRDTGEEIWAAELTAGSLQGGVMASAAVAEGQIFLTSNEAGGPAELFALDAATGEESWRTSVGSSVVGPVTWSNGIVYLADNGGRLAAFDAADGELLWSHDVAAPAAGGIAVVDGTVYAGWGWWLAGAPDNPQGGLIAFEATGDGRDGSGDDEPDGAPDGGALFEQHCAVCHGSEGVGGSGPSLESVGDRVASDDIADVIRDGRNQMPAWEDDLTDAELDALVTYLETL